MLTTAKHRFATCDDSRYIQRGFAGLISGSSVLGMFDVVVSAFAIRHVGRHLCRELFTNAFRHLEPGGSFMNVEATLLNVTADTQWYYVLWQKWIIRHGEALGLGAKFGVLQNQTRTNPGNQYCASGDY